MDSVARLKSVKKFAIQNFGCRASQADGAALESLLAKNGFAPAQTSEQPEVVILNTCTVTSAADEEVRQTVRRIHRENPDGRIVVTGCYAQRAPDELAALPGVSMVVGNSHKTRIAELLADPSAPFHGEVHVGDIFAQQEFLASPVEQAGTDRSRPNLKIQDGCNNRCSFCIIPFVRGRSRSAPVQQIIQQVRDLSTRYREIVLTGINLGRWGREPGSTLRLPDLLRMILAETDIGRLRLSSVEPMDFTDDLLGLIADSPRIAKHVHAPLQSGSDTVLRRMYRKYRPRHYEDRIRKARTWIPDAAIGADVMVGFPGETDEEFEQTRAFIERLPFTYLHIFPYSERPGTPAADRSDQVPHAVRRARGRILKELGLAKNAAFRKSMVGRIIPAVTLQDPAFAMTTNYLRVELASIHEPRELLALEIGGVSETGLRERTAFPLLF
jgi:threonylcarbamoyladenosine tRNA methylthiotransferase MtaB